MCPSVWPTGLAPFDPASHTYIRLLFKKLNFHCNQQHVFYILYINDKFLKNDTGLAGF